MRPTSPYRRFCRAAAAAFLLVAFYTVLVKLPGGLDGDWAHTAVHVATAAAAAYAGWMADRNAFAKAFTLAVAAGYGAIGLGGWFIDGLLMDTTLRIPLGPEDNVFHLLVAAGAVAAMIAGSRARMTAAI